MTAALPNRPDRPRRPVGTPWVKAVAGPGVEPGSAPRDGTEPTEPEATRPAPVGVDGSAVAAPAAEPGMDRTKAPELAESGALRAVPAGVDGVAVAEPGLAEQLACVRAVRELLAGIDGHGADASDPLRIDLLTATEELKGAITAAQARVTVAFGESQHQAGEADGRSARGVDQGISPQLALARRCSASTADRHRSLAASLTTVLPHTLAALTAGTIGEAHAQAMHTATTGLSAEVRMVIDSRLAGRLPILTPKQLGAAATHLAAELDVEALVAKHRLAVTNRGAWTRPAPDGMAYLTVLGPLPEIVGAVAALHAHATAVVAGHAQDDPAQARTHAQVMADTALTRLSGRAVGQAQPVAVTLVMTPDNLYGHHTNPYLAADHTDTDSDDSDSGGLKTGAGPDTKTGTGAGEVGSGRRLRLVSDPAAKDGTSDGSPNEGAQAADVTTAGSTDHDDPEDTDPGTELDIDTAEGVGTATGPGTARERGTADGPGTADSGTADDPETAADSGTAEGPGTPTDSGTADGPDTTARPGTAADPDAAAGDDRDKSHRPGTRARCAATATPVRIVGHGPIAAPLARAWLLNGCDTSDNDIDGDAPQDHHPPDHTDLPRPDPIPSSQAEPADRSGDDIQPISMAASHPAEVWLRRAFTSADGRDLIALESTARLFPPQLRALLVLRDDKCRIPFCDAPIRHADHITPVVAGGPTTLTNGQGLSARCNYTKDLAGFSTRTLTDTELADFAAGPDSDGNTQIARQAGPDTHVTAVTTPTGHTYLSSNPPALGWASPA